MREWQKRAIMLAAMLLLFIPAIALVLNGSLTCGYDNVFHLYRAVQVDKLWQDGVFISRWAPDMAHGYGFPLFVFTSPLAPMVSAALHRLLPIDWALSLNLTFALGMVIGGLGMAVLASEMWGRGAGVVSAVAYIYAPFQAYDVFNRGSLWESFAWAWVPWALWGLQRWMQQRDRRGLQLGVLAFTLMVLSHHLFAFLFAPLLALWVLVGAIQARDWTVFWRGVVFGLLGMGLSAFFWIPPLLETGFVQTDRLLGTWVFDYHYNFLNWRDVFALPRQADPLLLNDWPEKALGLVPALLAVLPFFAWRKWSKDQRGWIVMLWVLVLGFTFLVLPQSLWVWEHVPLLPYVQFPWRYLGPAATALALLVGAGWKLLPVGRKQENSALDGAPPGYGNWLWVGLLSAAIILANLGWFFPETCPGVPDPSARGMILWEKETDTIGTTAKGEYLPKWTHSLPDATPLDASYTAHDKAIMRLLPEELPEGTEVLEQQVGPTGADIIVDGTVAFTARYHVLYYPGWRVYLNGERVKVTPDPILGIVTFEVPQGSHTIQVRFVETAIRLIADGVSVVALMVWVWLMNTATVVVGRAEPASKERVWALLIVAVVLLVLRFVVIENLPVLWRGSRFGADVLAGTAAPVDVNFENRARFLDWEPLPAAVKADESPVLTLYWQALVPEDKEWRIGVTLRDAYGIGWQAGLRPVRSKREPPMLALWPADRYARMDYHLDLPAGIAPGKYEVSLALFDRATGHPTSVLDAAGNPVSPNLVLTTLTVLPPDIPPTLAALGVDSSAKMIPCAGVGLWQFSGDREQLVSGELLALRTVWEKLAVSDPVPVSFRLEDNPGKPQKTWDIPLVVDNMGQRWVQRSMVRIPGSLESGDYSLVLGLPGCDRIVTLPITVTAPERNWSLPERYSTTDVVFGKAIQLVGVQVTPAEVEAGDDVEVDLAWKALTEMETSYRVFAHVVRVEDAVVVAQRDNEPANWSRPTTGWAVDEVVLDSRVLNLPAELHPGQYEVRVGVYSLDEGRLATVGGDYLVVMGFEVE